MKKNKTMDDLDSLRKVALGGALTIKSVDVIGHAKNPTALTGDLESFIGIGIAGKTSGIVMDLITGKYKKKKKVKKMTYGIPKRDGSGRGIRANRLRNPACR